MINGHKYVYDAYVTKVYDGDTITVDIDLGLDVWIKDKSIRLAGIDTPEIRGEERPAGLVARDALREKVLDKKIIIETDKDSTGKYGRYIAIVYIKADPELLTEEEVSAGVTHLNINNWLVVEGFAEKIEY